MADLHLKSAMVYQRDKSNKYDIIGFVNEVCRTQFECNVEIIALFNDWRIR